MIKQFNKKSKNKLNVSEYQLESKIIFHRSIIPVQSSFEFKFINLPFFDIKLALWISCEQSWSILTSDVISIVVVTDWELTVRLFLVWRIHDTNVTASESRTTFGIWSNSELSKVKLELFAHVYWKDETLERFISNPMLLVACPCHWSISTELLAEFVVNQCQCFRNIVTEFVELFDREVMLRSSENQFSWLDHSSFEMWLNHRQIVQNLTLKLSAFNVWIELLNRLWWLRITWRRHGLIRIFSWVVFGWSIGWWQWHILLWSCQMFLVRSMSVC